MEKISCSDHVKNIDVLHTQEEKEHPTCNKTKGG
jgi:hypothetical protein